MQTPLEALAQQLTCYQRLLKLSDLQRMHVQQNRTDELLTVLEARSQILTQIGHLETIVSPLKKDWAGQSLLMTPDVRENAKTMLAEARTLLLKITQADMDDVLVLQQRKLAIGKQIQQTGVAKRVNTRYAGNAYGQMSNGSKLNLKS
jgi:hypothetical protein